MVTSNIVLHLLNWSLLCHSLSTLKPWLVAEQTHCDCMDGIGEKCTHLSALFFWIPTNKIDFSTIITVILFCVFLSDIA